MPVLASFEYALVGQPSMQDGSKQWLQAIDRCSLCVAGNTPPSTSPTRLQETSAGLPFCCAHATSQHLQPMHFVMSKWKRYCWPSSSGMSGMSPCGPSSPRAARLPPFSCPMTVNGLAACSRDVDATCTSYGSLLSQSRDQSRRAAPQRGRAARSASISCVGKPPPPGPALRRLAARYRRGSGLGPGYGAGPAGAGASRAARRP